METASFIVALVALFISVIALISSIIQAKRADGIALYAHRLNFYNRTTDILDRYGSLKMIDALIDQQTIIDPSKVNIVASFLSSNHKKNNEPDLICAVRMIKEDINFLRLHKGLFKRYTKDIDNLVCEIKNFQAAFENCIKLLPNRNGTARERFNRNQELNNTLQPAIDKLVSFIENFKKRAFPQIENIIVQSLNFKN